MLLTMFTLTACGEKKIDLKEYTTVEFTGIDGEGEASIDFDRNALGMAFIEASGMKDTFNKQAVELAGKLSAFINTIDYQVAPKENLKNGDEVTVTFSYDEKAAQTAGVAPQNATYTLTVEGLTEAIEVDAFDPSFFNTERGVMIMTSPTERTSPSPPPCPRARRRKAMSSRKRPMSSRSRISLTT